jgi:hypothetical protein
MATTTATVNITSPDLLPSTALNLNASSTIVKTGLTDGLEFVDMGRGELTVAGAGDALHEVSASSGDYDTSNWLYLYNGATDPTYYIQVTLHATIIGRLYAGDWMWIPWHMGDADQEIEVEAEGGTCPYEYAIFKSAYTLPAGT